MPSALPSLFAVRQPESASAPRASRTRKTPTPERGAKERARDLRACRPDAGGRGGGPSFGVKDERTGLRRSTGTKKLAEGKTSR